MYATKRRKQTLLQRWMQTRPLFALLCVPVIAVVFVLLASYIASPAQGVISAVQASLFATSSNFNETPVQVRDAYASFSCPKALLSVASQRLIQPVVATHDWTYHDVQTWHVAVSVLAVGSESLADNNAYLFRQRNPSRFIESHDVVNGQQVTVMTDTSATGFSKVGFLTNGRYQAVISLFGDDQTGGSDLQTTWQMILSSWHWLQA